MSQRDRTTIHVGLLAIESELLLDRHRSPLYSYEFCWISKRTKLDGSRENQFEQ
jgi:hypothetical protein